MSIQVSAADPVVINFSPSPVEEVVQNIRTILSTLRGTVPLNRGFGIDLSLIDEPTPIAKARLTSIVISAVKLHEPRAVVKAISFKEELNAGRLVPVVHIDLAGEEG
jgi:phage baseplate assembly protein W